MPDEFEREPPIDPFATAERRRFFGLYDRRTSQDLTHRESGAGVRVPRWVLMAAVPLVVALVGWAKHMTLDSKEEIAAHAADLKAANIHTDSGITRVLDTIRTRDADHANERIRDSAQIAEVVLLLRDEICTHHPERARCQQ